MERVKYHVYSDCNPPPRWHHGFVDFRAQNWHQKLAILPPQIWHFLNHSGPEHRPERSRGNDPAPSDPSELQNRKMAVTRKTCQFFRKSSFRSSRSYTQKPLCAPKQLPCQFSGRSGAPNVPDGALYEKGRAEINLDSFEKHALALQLYLRAASFFLTGKCLLGEVAPRDKAKVGIQQPKLQEESLAMPGQVKAEPRADLESLPKNFPKNPRSSMILGPTSGPVLGTINGPEQGFVDLSS